MIISRYLAREVINALLVVISVLLLAFISQQLVRYLNFVALGKIPSSVLLELVSFEVPYLLALLLPLALYLGVLLAYGRLYADNEMAILMMCGYGHWRLMRLTMLIAVMVSGVVFYLMLFVNPLISAKRQQVMSSGEATLHLIQTLMPGRFQVSPDGSHVMYVEKLSRDRTRASNVFLAQAKADPEDPEKSTWMLVSARQGYQMEASAGREQFFVTTDGYRYEGTPGQNNYKIIQFEKYAVRIPQVDARVTHFEAETLPSLTLLEDYQQPQRAAELQWRVSVGISTFLLAMLAVPLCAIRPRQSRYLMLLPAVFIYIAYINLLFFARRFVEAGVVPVWFGMWWVHGLMLLAISLAVLFNARKFSGKA